jgi:hypothetical protein
MKPKMLLYATLCGATLGLGGCVVYPAPGAYQPQAVAAAPAYYYAPAPYYYPAYPAYGSVDVGIGFGHGWGHGWHGHGGRW